MPNPTKTTYRVKRTPEGNYRIEQQSNGETLWRTAFAEIAATRKTAKQWIECHEYAVREAHRA